MVGRKRRALPVDMARVAGRFQDWRRTRRTGTRIPERLWTQAAQLAAEHGVARTASALSLDYYALQKRVQLSGFGSQSAKPAFMEFPPASFSPTRECVIELEDQAGGRLRMSLQGYDAAELGVLTQGFWKPQ
jgi:hypothetical protein